MNDESKPIFKYQRPNERNPELESITSLHPLPEQVSANRLAMFTGHLSQILHAKGANRPSIVTGQELEMGKAEFDVRLPYDAYILKAIPRFPARIGKGSFSVNPQTILIYEYDELVDANTGEHRKVVDYIDCPNIHHLHQEFGFHFDYDLEPTRLERHTLEQGTRIAGSPSVDKDGFWCYGVETNVAMMSIPQVTEDGVVASRSFCERNLLNGIKRFTVSYGRKEFPVNLYGDGSEYKPHPDIGEHVRDDGLLMALRPYDDELFPVYNAPTALREANLKRDTCYFAEPGAKIADIRVYHESRLRTAHKESRLTTPEPMRSQDELYWDAEVKFHQQIVDYYQQLKRTGQMPYLTPRLRALIARAMANCRSFVDPVNRYNVPRKYRNQQIDEWMIEITVSYPIRPAEASKFTDISGGKGVITEIWEDEDMPVDADGNRADMIMDGMAATIKRMNISRLTEQYIKAGNRDHHRRLLRLQREGVSRDELRRQLTEYYSITSPRMLKFTSIIADDEMVSGQHLDCVLRDGITIYLPTDKEREPLEIVRDIQRYYPPTLGPVRYRNQQRQHVDTAWDVLIGPMYILPLERTGKSWSAVASSRLSHFGMPTKLTASDRDSVPTRQTPVRFGEDEFRLFMAMCGGRATARFYNRTANPIVRKVSQEAILRSERPSAMEACYDRNEYPSGNTRVATMVRHFAECSGWRFRRKVRDEEN